MRLDDDFAEIAQIVDEFFESGHAVFGAVVPGVDEVLLAAFVREGRCTVSLFECEAGKLPDCEDGSVVVIGKAVALKATQCGMRVLRVAASLRLRWLWWCCSGRRAG